MHRPLRRSALVAALVMASPALAQETATGVETATAAGTTDRSSNAARPDAALQKAQELLNQRQPRSAFERLAPLEDEYSGNPDYDYLYGLSALESGQASTAAFAFERCLAVDPKNGPCRVQMARAHMALGENASAEAELKTIKEYNPPPEVANLMNRYLGDLANRKKSENRRIGAWAQVGLGHDSNVNSANSTSQLAVSLPGGSVLAFAVAPEDRNQSDSFLQASAGASLHQKLDPAWSLLADVAVNSRGYGEVDRFSYGSADLGLGTSYTAGPHNFVLKALGQKYRLDDQAFRALWGGMAQYQYLASESQQFSAYVQGTRLAYEAQGARDADRYTLGLAWTQALEMSLQPVLYAGLYGGQETPLDEQNVEHLGYDFYGLRGGGALFLSRVLQLNASLSVEKRKNNAVYPVALPTLVTRSDTQYDASLGLTYMVAPHISIRPAYSYSDSNSNLIINDYHRNVVSLDFRYEL